MDGVSNIIERADIHNTNFAGTGIYIERGASNEIYGSIVEYSSTTEHYTDYGIVR